MSTDLVARVRQIGLHDRDYAENALAEEAADRIEQLEAEVAAAPALCDCHPGVRWPVEHWGKPCPLTADRIAREQAEGMVAALREAGDKALPFIQLCEVEDSIMDEWRSARDALHDAVMKSTTVAAAHDARVRREALEEAALWFLNVAGPRFGIKPHAVDAIVDAVRALAQSGDPDKGEGQ